jgi:hypothetical protein
MRGIIGHSPRPALLLLMAVTMATSSCCRRKRPPPPELEVPTSTNWSRQLPPPAGADVTALLNGLKAGDSVQGHAVTAIGAVNRDGSIPIIFVDQDRAILLLVAEKSDLPKAPKETGRYGIYYQGFDGLKPLPPGDTQKLMEGLEERIRKVEDKVAPPKGLGPLPRPSLPI